MAAGSPPEDLLVVEDDEELASLVALLLEDRGYAVHTARRGAELTPDVRSQVFLGWLSTFVFAIAFLFVLAKIAGPAMPEARRKRRMPKRYEPPVT